MAGGAGVDDILALRVLKANGWWDEYWASRRCRSARLPQLGRQELRGRRCKIRRQKSRESKPYQQNVINPPRGEGVDLEDGSPLVLFGFEHGRVRRRLAVAFCDHPSQTTARPSDLPDGKIASGLKTPWRDGAVGIVPTATQLVAPLAALVSRPGQNLVRYHGVLAANAGERAAIVPGGHGRVGQAQKETIEDGRVVPPRVPPLPPMPRKHGGYP